MARTPDEMANELETVENVGGQMAEDLMAEQANATLVGDKEPEKVSAGEPQAVTETPAAEASVQTPQATEIAAEAPSEAPSPEPEPVSFLSGMEDVDEDDGEPAPASKTPSVPPGMIRDIQSEREKRKAAEQQAAEYQRKLAEYEAKQQQTTALDLNAILGEGEDDDFVDRKTVAKAIQAATQQAAEQARAASAQEAQRREQAQQAQAAKHQRQQAMKASEAAIRKTVSDYDAVVKKAIDLNVMSLDDKRAILSSPNPAGTLYFKAKQVLNAFGIQPVPVTPPPAALPEDGKPPKTNEKEPSGDEILSDEDLYNTVFSR